jgi:negative regulator of sigma E activity
MNPPMSEQIQEQISALMDDELSIEECTFLVRRLERDPAARRKFASYATIGAALRGELLQPDPAILRRRLEQTLSGAAPPAPAPASSRRAGWARKLATPALGIGIAASVAAAGLLVLRAGSEWGGAVTPVAEPLQAAAPVSEPRSYVVPQSVAARDTVQQPIRLTNYLVHHGEYASGLSRTSVHSNVVAGQETRVSIESAQPPE